MGLPERLFEFENRAKGAGYSKIAGIDEAGRGPLAGPVAASAVIIRDPDFAERIDDSKKLSEKKREKAYLDIIKRCDVGIGLASVEEIDKLNIFRATLLAMERAVKDLPVSPDYLLIDGNMDVAVPQPRMCLVAGDARSVSIACASIIAKVFRDRLMLEIDARYPEYGFKKHKGYGTGEHMEAIRKHGLSPVHRQSFGPFGSGSKGANRKSNVKKGA